MTRPRVRSQAGQELELPSVTFAAHRDPLDARTLHAVACGISTRKYARSLETLPDEIAERSTSKSAVSRRYVALTTTQLTRWLTTPLGDRHFPIVLIDGIHLGDHTVLIALGIDTEGKKQILGLREGHTEHSRVVKALLRDLAERGVDPERARLFVIDGAKALASAIRTVFGPLAAVQRCQLHKRRNILGHLPERWHANVTSVLRDAWEAGDAARAARQLERLAASLEPIVRARPWHWGQCRFRHELYQTRRCPQRSHCSTWPPRAAVRHCVRAVITRRCAVERAAPTRARNVSP